MTGAVREQQLTNTTNDHPNTDPSVVYDYGSEDMDDDLCDDDVTDGEMLVDQRNTEKKDVVVSSQQNRAVWSLRVLVFLLLGGAACGVCFNVYTKAATSEREKFKEDFTYLGDKLLENFAATLSQRMGVVDNFARDITSEANHNPSLEWPFVTVSDFEYRAASTCRLADVVNLVLANYVEDGMKEEWEEYAVAHQSWRREGLIIQEQKAAARRGEIFDPTLLPDGFVLENISSVIQRPGPNRTGPIEETRPGPYLVAWQSYPVINKSLANMNFLNNPRHALAAVVVDSHLPALAKSFDFWKEETISGRRQDFDLFLIQYEQGGVEYDGSPVGHFYYPVFDEISLGLGGPQYGPRNVTGILMGAIFWKTYFRNALPEGKTGVVVVLKNSCGQIYTYRVFGADAEFVGHGDLHDNHYDYLEMGTDAVEFNVGEFGGLVSNGSCIYSLRVYPSVELEHYYTSSDPFYQTFWIAIMFTVTSAVFIVYDICVERRQRVVQQKARQARAVVSELFPEDVRERLYDNRDANKTRTTPWHQQRKDSFQDEKDEPSKQNSTMNARLYPECTILFADLVGFTHWSSGRSPVEVFELLQTLFEAFDSLASRRGVYKIETIGDCYLAATGIPESQPAHALIMAKFANDCLRGLSQLKEELVDKLGDDTADLALRIGLNSGDVTAGVLRGSKSRFQVFGDTVNTGARMESTGERNRIQCSSSTAILLQKAGKGGWLKARDTRVAAKGKGEMQTYWIDVRTTDTTKTSSLEFTVENKKSPSLVSL